MSQRMAALALTLVLGAALSGCAVAPVQAGEPLRIATWNLEHLSEDGAQGCRPLNRAALRGAQRRQDEPQWRQD